MRREPTHQMTCNPEIASLTYNREAMQVRIKYVNGGSMVLTHVVLDYEASGVLRVVKAEGHFVDVRVEGFTNAG